MALNQSAPGLGHYMLEIGMVNVPRPNIPISIMVSYDSKWILFVMTSVNCGYTKPDGVVLRCQVRDDSGDHVKILDGNSRLKK